MNLSRVAEAGVIMRVQPHPALLKRALNSICSQSFTDWELLVVVEGGDPDPVSRAIEDLPDESQSRIRILVSEEATGMAAAANAGLRSLQARFVHVHDEAHSLHPEFLQKAVSYLRNPTHPSVKGVVTRAEQVFEQIEEGVIQPIRREPWNDWLCHIGLRRLLADNVIAQIAFIFDRESALSVGGFDESLPVLEDWEFNVRFLSKFELAVIPEVLASLHQIEGLANPHEEAEGARQRLFFDNLLRNEWLRKDIASGRTGPGVIANEARLLRNLREKFKNRSLRLLKDDPANL